MSNTSDFSPRGVRRAVDTIRAVLGRSVSLALTGASVDGHEESTVQESVASVANENINLVGAGSGGVSRPQDRRGSVHTRAGGGRSKNRAGRERGSVDVGGFAVGVVGDLLAIDIDAKHIVEVTANPLWILLGGKNEFGGKSREPRLQDDVHGKERGIEGCDPAIESFAHGISTSAIGLADIILRAGAGNHIDGITGGQDDGITDSKRTLCVKPRAGSSTGEGRRDQREALAEKSFGECVGIVAWSD